MVTIDFDQYKWATWMAVDNDGDVWLFDTEPNKNNGLWSSGGKSHHVDSLPCHNVNITISAVPLNNITGKWVVNDGLRYRQVSGDCVMTDGFFNRQKNNATQCLFAQAYSKGRVALYREEQKAGGDPVNSPPHYTQGGIECIEAIKAALTPEEFRGYCKGNAIKYVWRCEHKGKREEDLAKARWYLGRLIGE